MNLKECVKASFLLFILMFSFFLGNSQSVTISRRNLSHVISNKVEIKSEILPDGDKKVRLSGNISKLNISAALVERAGEDEYFGKVGDLTINNKDENFTYTDNSPLTGKSYYRLAWHDQDGSLIYSKTTAVTAKENSALLLYPNPVKNVLTVAIQGGDQEGFISIHDLNGHELYNLHIFGNSTQTDLDVSYLESAVYLLQYRDSKRCITKQIVKN